MKKTIVLTGVGLAAWLTGGLAQAGQAATTVGQAARAETPPSADVRTLFDVHTKMRDGVELVSDIWMPAAPGRHPVLLERTAYVRTKARRFPSTPESWVRRGYVYVRQDCRGRGDSGGRYWFMGTDSPDGYDTVEWIAAQPWSNGRVGMIGGSYMAMTAWHAARAAPPHLLAIVARAGASNYFEEAPYSGGALKLEWATHWMPNLYPPPPGVTPADDDAMYRHRPLISMEKLFGRPVPIWREVLEHPTMDAFWKPAHFTEADFKPITVAALGITGWFDSGQPGTIYYWEQMRKHSPARDRQYLLIGAWDHGGVMRGGRAITNSGKDTGTVKGGVLTQGDMVFNKEAIIDDTRIVAAFLDKYLKGHGTFEQPRVQVYTTGDNRWRDLPDYPPAATPRALYFHGLGKANTGAGDGSLDFTAPGDERSDEYTYDPAQPVPTHEGETGKDQRALETREDVLVYTSAVLDKPLTVMGRVRVELHAATDARDTDFTARLIDVAPDGKAVKLGPKPTGVIRGRYRLGYDQERLITPGAVDRYPIDLFDIGHVFLPGHRIRVDISSSAFPALHPNPNTGNPVATDTESRAARQQIHHRRGAASHVVLPVIPE